MASLAASVQLTKMTDAETAGTAAACTPTTMSRQNSDSVQALSASSRSNSPAPMSPPQCQQESLPKHVESTPFGNVLYAARFHEMSDWECSGSVAPPAPLASEDAQSSVADVSAGAYKRVPFAQKLALRASTLDENISAMTAAPMSMDQQPRVCITTKVPFAQKLLSARMCDSETPETCTGSPAVSCCHGSVQRSSALEPVACSTTGPPDTVEIPFAQKIFAARGNDFDGAESCSSVAVSKQASGDICMERPSLSSSVPFSQKLASVKMYHDRFPESESDRMIATQFSGSLHTASSKQAECKSDAIVRNSFAQVKFAARMHDEMAMMF